MRRVNKVIVLFLTIVILLIISIWSVLQSAYFAQIVSKRISTMAENQLNAKISFKKINFRIIPLGLVLEDLILIKNKSSDDEKVVPEIKVQKAYVYFYFLDLFVNRLAIKRIGLERGIVSFPVDIHSEPGFDFKKFVASVKNKENETHENIALYLNKIFNKSLPILVKNIALKDIYLDLDDIRGQVQYLDIMLSKNYKEVAASIENISILLREGSSLPTLQNRIELDSITCGLYFDAGRKVIKIKKLFANKEINRIDVQGVISLNPLAIFDSELKMDQQATIGLDHALSYIDIRKYFFIDRGVLSAKTTISGKLARPEGKMVGKVEDLVSKFVKVKEIEFELAKKKDLFLVNSMTIMQDDESAELVKSFTLYDGENKRLLPDAVYLNVNRLKLSTGFYFIRSILYPLQGEITGQVEFKYKDKLLTFTPIGKALLTNVEVDIGREKRVHILNAYEAWLNSATFNVDLKGDLAPIVDFKADLAVGESRIQGTGLINKEIIDIKTHNAYIDIDDLGQLMGINVKGKGGVDLRVHGNLITKDISFDFKLDMIDGSIFNILLGKINTEFKFDLKKMYLNFIPTRSSGEYASTSYQLEGGIDFKQKDIKLDVKVASATYEDLREMFHKMLEKVEKFIPNRFEGFLTSNVKIRGGLKIPELIVEGAFNGGELVIWNEDFSSLEGKFLFKDETISFDDLLLKKDQGVVSGYYRKKLKEKKYEVKTLVSNLSVTKLNFYNRLGLGLKGKLNGFLEAKREDKLSGLANFTFSDAHINDDAVPESEIAINIIDSIVDIKGQLLAKVIEIKSSLDLEAKEGEGKRSSFNFIVRTSDLNLLAAILSPHNISDTSLRGNISCELSSKFNIKELKKLDLDFLMEDFYFMRGNSVFNLYQESDRILIKDGLIEKWDINLEGEGGIFKSIGRGHLNRHFVIKSFLNFDASLLEVLTNKIISSDGKIETSIVATGENGVTDLNVSSEANDFSLVYTGLPGNFENVHYKLNANNRLLQIEDFSGKFATGQFKSNGIIELSIPQPSLDLKFSIENSNVSYFKKTNILISGNGTISGKERPYLFRGEFSIISALMHDEFEDLSKNKYGSGKVSNRFIPKIQKKKTTKDFLELDLNMASINNFMIKNSLIEMGLMGKLKVGGLLSSPKAHGNISLMPNTGKVFFKNNDFILSKGSLTMYPEDDTINPELMFEGVSKISNYDVIFSLSGRSNDFNIELSSNPSLPQKDILSLLTLGFTDDVSKNLDASDRMSLTQAGIGSILMNRLKLDEGLKSSLGVNFGLSSEVSEGGGSSELEGSKLRSATKMTASKPITKKMDLTGYKTVGGDTKKQGMNLNYEVNKKISLDGVYEETTENTQEEKSISAGADVKFRWTFK